MVRSESNIILHPTRARIACNAEVSYKLIQEHIVSMRQSFSAKPFRARAEITNYFRNLLIPACRSSFRSSIVN